MSKIRHGVGFSRALAAMNDRFRRDIASAGGSPNDCSRRAPGMCAVPAIVGKVNEKPTLGYIGWRPLSARAGRDGWIAEATMHTTIPPIVGFLTRP